MEYCSIRLSKLTVRINFLRERRGWAIYSGGLPCNVESLECFITNAKMSKRKINWKSYVLIENLWEWVYKCTWQSLSTVSLFDSKNVICKKYFPCFFFCIMLTVKKDFELMNCACILLKSNLVFSFDWKLSTYLG